jgi:transcription elongation factor GreB
VSKAFTKDEGEGSHEAPALPLGAPLPPGAKNYVTPGGAAALRARLGEAQLALDQARAAGDAARALQAQQRLEFFAERTAAMEEVSPPAAPNPDGPIRFGARVVTRDADGLERRIQIVGVDEADPAHGLVSWTAPLARALIGHLTGDEVQVQTPQGLIALEILAVDLT